MHRSVSGSMRPFALLAVWLVMLSDARAGPLGALDANVTGRAITTTNVGCTVGDAVYTMADEIPGASACERCKCGEGGAVSCSRVRCEPRPGCKAIHRPDHCCPTYQCECEQGGRVYGNGEKLVDATEPCRVCYCQGGEVVCRKVACFLRDDCKPRLVPGRCCPEYDNCPIRGVTALPGLSPPSAASEKSAEATSPSAAPDKVKQEITIKEITPISEIPIIGGVQVEESPPTANVDDDRLTSSKSPLIVREASTDTPRTTTTAETPLTTPTPLLTTHRTDITSTPETSARTSALPEKESASTATHSSTERPTSTATPLPTTTANASLIDEEDPSLFDHNPAFPPIPDDLSVLSNRGDEIVPEASMDNDHNRDTQTYATHSPGDASTERSITADGLAIKSSPMLNLRAAIPTDILNLPAAVAEEINGQYDEEDATNADEEVTPTEAPTAQEKQSKAAAEIEPEETANSAGPATKAEDDDAQKQTTSSIDESNIATEVTSQPEISSLPIEHKPSPADISRDLTTAADATTDRPNVATRGKSDVLADLINLVGDVATIGGNGPPPPERAIPESEELIPVNAGYKSKNNNWSANSITDTPHKMRGEIDDVDDAPITDATPPGDDVEPTTRRPIIDTVGAHANDANKTLNKDIEIITQSYVPTINRRPTKVVLGAEGAP